MPSFYCKSAHSVLNWPMKTQARALTAVLVLVLSFTQDNSALANIRIGSECKKPNSFSKVNGTKVKCTKSGKKFIWQKVTIKKAPKGIQGESNEGKADSSGNVQLPTSFSDLVKNSAGIPRAAWAKASEVIESNSVRLGTLEIFTGSNTKVTFDDYPKALGLVSQLFPAREVPNQNLVIRYSFEDLDWAEKKVREMLSANDYQQLNRNENGRLITSNCDEVRKTCIGSKQLTTPSNINLLLQGIPQSYDVNDPNARERLYSGMLEVHEYFHSLQRIPMLNKEPRTEVWPHAWFREGSAEWVQNVTINQKNFDKYSSYRKNNCGGSCGELTEKDIIKYLKLANGNEVPPEFDRWLDYSLGSRVVEALVSISSPDSIIAVYEEMSRKVDFSGAFKKVYGLEWVDAIPLLAKAIHDNL